MSLVELYKQLCLNPEYYDFYYSTSGKNGGKVFYFINTNYRGILSSSNGELQGFAKGFRVIENVENVKRSSWARKAGTLQEIEKQHVVNMRKAEFFRVVDDAYTKTSRGIVFKKMVEDNQLSYLEKKFICLLLILSGYFADIPNYILEQTKFFFDRCYEAGYTVDEILAVQKDFIGCAESLSKNSSYFAHEYLYLDSFYRSFNDIDFLKLYKESSTSERQELSKYIITNHRSKSNNCILSNKYRSGGNYTFNTLLEDAWILFVARKILDAHIVDFDDFVSTAIDAYRELFNVNESNLKSFIYNTDKNRSVFQVVYSKVMNVPISPLLVEKDFTEEELKELSLSDATDQEGAAALDILSSSLKKLAKLNTGYRCVLEDIEMCKYFTAKENSKNYLEIHHLIPREFSNDFDSPIEILDNYVALCPNCHRKIHLAVDSERKHMINKLFNSRKDKLVKNGLNIDIKTLYHYYKIDD